MRNVLFITNYFYPEHASLGQLMTDLCMGLQDKMKITVVAMIPGYTEDVKEKFKEDYPGRVNFSVYQKMNIFRVYATRVDKSSKISRISHILTYFFYSIFALIRSRKQDVVFCVSQPPVLGGILGVLGKVFKRAKLIYNIQDFNPEQIEAVGYSKKRAILQLLRKMDNFSLRCSDAIVLVGQDQKETITKRGLSKALGKIHIINNWINQKEIYPLPEDHKGLQEFKERYGMEHKKVFMYSGNLGLFYDLENLVRIMGKFKSEQELLFVLVGDGAMKPKLVQYCEENSLRNILFIPYQEKEKLIYSLNSADVHIVANLKGIKGVSVPSKLYGVMAVAKPIIGILEKGSEARSIIEESGCGVCVDPGDFSNIELALKNFSRKEATELKELGKKGRIFLEGHLTMEVSLEKYLHLINNL